MHSPTIGTLALPGATLHYEVRGSGPTLLIIPSGNGDAAPFGPLADLLSSRYQVITYDRRGYSRSPLTRPIDDSTRIADDADDVRDLLDHLADGPAHVFGTSSGAIVALAFLERHPKLARTLISHEPPLASVLPDADHWLAFYARLYDVYRGSGIEEAKKVFRSGMGMDTPTRAPKETEQSPEDLAAMLERLRRNQTLWYEHEILVFPAYQPDFDVLATVSDRLVLAGGDLSRQDFPYRPNVSIGQRLGIEITHLPGGHVGYVTHPFQFADELAALLDTRTD